MALSISSINLPYSNVVLLEDVRNRPIPCPAEMKTALDYHQIPIDCLGRMNQEPLVELEQYEVASRSAYARSLAPYYRAFATALSTVFVRRTVAEKLAKANELLRPYDVEILALDGFRPIELQIELWNHFVEMGEAILHNPSEDELTNFAGLFCSDPRGFDPDDFRTWPVHNTGGAIDLTLRSLQDKQELFMGSIFDDADTISGTRYFEDQSWSSQSAREAKRNRRLLFHTMAAVGLVNYSHEWWHFDFGTQMWAMNSGLTCHANYGRTCLAKHSGQIFSD